jgi:hypothetical protein
VASDNNLAGRLFTLLETAQKIPPNKRVKDALIDLLKIPTTEDSIVMRRGSAHGDPSPT